MRRFLSTVAATAVLTLTLASAGCGSSGGGNGGSAGTGGHGGSAGTAGGGGSGGSSSGGTVDVRCTGKIGMQLICSAYKNLAPAMMSTICRTEGLSETSACPTGNLTGCCNDEPLPGSHATYSECYYSVASSVVPSLKSNCEASKGTWQAK